MTDATLLWLVYFTATAGVFASIATTLLITRINRGKIRGLAVHLLGIILTLSLLGVVFALRDAYNVTRILGMPIHYFEYAVLGIIYVGVYAQLSHVEEQYCFEH